MKNILRSILASSFVAMSLACSVVHAGVITLTATHINPSLADSGFTVEFNDNNKNGLFDLSELVSFSGARALGVDLVSILGIPDIEGIAVLGWLPGAYQAVNYWSFERAGEVDGRWDIAESSGGWTYKLSDASQVPEPSSLLLVAAGLAGIATVLKRKQV